MIAEELLGDLHAKTFTDCQHEIFNVKMLLNLLRLLDIGKGSETNDGDLLWQRKSFQRDKYVIKPPLHAFKRAINNVASHAADILLARRRAKRCLRGRLQTIPFFPIPFHLFLGPLLR